MLKALPEKYSRWLQDTLIIILVLSMLTAGLALISASKAVNKSTATQHFLCGLIVGSSANQAKTQKERLASSKLFRDHASEAAIRAYFRDRVIVLTERVQDTKQAALVADVNEQCGTKFPTR